MLHRPSIGNKSDSSPHTEDSPPQPCWFMKGLLSALCDDSLTGVSRWYAENHAKGCPHCSETLASLRVVRARLRAIGLPEVASEEEAETGTASDTLTAERRAALEAAWAMIDQEANREPISADAT